MRLTESEVKNLKSSVVDLDKDADIFLFGSRVDDCKRGGDIDLLIISTKISPEGLRRIKVNFYDEFGEQRIDILLDDGSLKEPFKELVYDEAIRL